MKRTYLLVLALLMLAGAIAGAQPKPKKVSFVDLLNPCVPTPEHPCSNPLVQIGSVPVPGDQEPPFDDMILNDRGFISREFLVQNLTRTLQGFPQGLGIFPASLKATYAPVNIRQVVFRYDYQGAFTVESDLDGYDISAQDLGATRVVTLTALPGALPLGGPVSVLKGPGYSSWNMTIGNFNDPALPAFYASHLNGQGFRAPQAVPEPGDFALVGVLLLGGATALRRRLRRN